METQYQPSMVQLHRRNWKPEIPKVLINPGVHKFPDKEPCVINSEAESELLNELLPHTEIGNVCSIFDNSESGGKRESVCLRIGVVLSGGPAPGGHNVIAGIFDYLEQYNSDSKLFGFLDGPQGVFNHKYINITAEHMMQYRNLGGFDMLRTGRHKIETESQKESSLKICNELRLDGLVIVGGDDSNTNAAILSDYFLGKNCQTKVIGCPKTIDGDLQNKYVQIPFGFDTATKTYSEMIGNLCLDLLTSGNHYHFVRLMGRSASHITLECALQTCPNLAFIGEEVEARGLTLSDLVREIIDLIIMRYNNDKNYGIILIPEGLIEFIPEIRRLIDELNHILAKGENIMDKLSPGNKDCFLRLPQSIREQLLLDRDPHGNVQVAKIATERLLIEMVEIEIEKRGLKGNILFSPVSHYFGYEGRCAIPSNFDANYCYALGRTTAALIEHNCTGYMAFVSSLHSNASMWSTGGYPLKQMMNIELRKGKNVPVIKKHLVDLNGKLFKLFCECRSTWKLEDMYRCPGPIQFDGPFADRITYSLLLPDKETFLSEQHSLFAVHCSKLNFAINPLLEAIGARAKPGNEALTLDTKANDITLKNFPYQISFLNKGVYTVESTADDVPIITSFNIGVVLFSKQAPGISNVLMGLFKRMSGRGTLYGFQSIMGLCCMNFKILDEDTLQKFCNQGGYTLLKRTMLDQRYIMPEDCIDRIQHTCSCLDLNGLVIIGDNHCLWLSAVISERFIKSEMMTKVVLIPASFDNDFDHNFIHCSLGFDTVSRCTNNFLGNLLTDVASAAKYYYFIRVAGSYKSHIALEAAFVCHPNMTLISELIVSTKKSLSDVVMLIADLVCRRSELGKDFGGIVIPEGLLADIPEILKLVDELSNIFKKCGDQELCNEILDVVKHDVINLKFDSIKLLASLSHDSVELLRILPTEIRRQFVEAIHHGKLQVWKIASEELLSKLVGDELCKRKGNGLYKGCFVPVCFYLGFQTRSSFPSKVDCSLATSYGYLAAICIESNLSGYAASIKYLKDGPDNYTFSAVPIIKLAKFEEDKFNAYNACKESFYGVNLNAPTYKIFQELSNKHEIEDRFCNPGPIQFFNPSLDFLNNYAAMT